MTLIIENNYVEAPLYSIISESSITEKLTDSLVISSDVKDVEPSIGLSIKGNGRATACAIIYPGTKGKIDFISIGTGLAEVYRFKAQTKKVRFKITKDMGLIASSDVQKEVVLELTEDCMSSYIADIDVAFLNKLYDLAPKIHSERVRITSDNIKNECERVEITSGGEVGSALVFTNTEDEGRVAELHELLGSSLEPGVRISMLPIQCLGLPIDESVLMILPQPELLGTTYYAQLPTATTTRSGNTFSVEIYETSVTVIPDIMSVSILC